MGQHPGQPAAQPGEFGPHRHRTAGVAEERLGELGGGTPLAVQREHVQQLGVARREMVRPTAHRPADRHRPRTRAGQLQHHPPGRGRPRRLPHPHQPPARQRLQHARTQRRQPHPAGLRGGRQRHPVHRRHPGHRGRPAVTVHRDRRTAEPGQHRRRRGPQPLHRLPVPGPQFALGHPGHRGHQRQGGRMHLGRRGADVHHAQQPPVPRIVQRRRRTRPPVVGPDEVLGGGDLQRGTGHHGGADPVGARRLLRPAGALRQVDAVGGAPPGPTPGTPQHPAVGVGHRHHVALPVGHRTQALPERGDDPGQRRLAAQRLQRVRGERRAVVADVRIQAPAQHPAPGLGDHRAGGRDGAGRPPRGRRLGW
ncbi:hypothetical protein SCATT_47280 [Streptantibioticus cattleyicolor NRRL 8057 = DSM 46488]|uniref:Uncharacterized protein n=1 Tax=Streptantibioticus cattleyicolor (strain ATCC 35852 / DSM 46488 / JCM 4925 / NBRC 14057 / NRRL 8057) TaxID=1003195 RepID=G8WT76_STREN|nr:hypothetical protein SCATT_47280 [Streptantibioticus cattleyicolor NRRL 8057 = DSM 46488]